MSVTDKAILIDIIQRKGNCPSSATHCNFCPVQKECPGTFEFIKTYDVAVKMYMNEYGEEELMELLL